MSQPLSVDLNELFSIIGELEVTRRKLLSQIAALTAQLEALKKPEPPA